MDGKLSQGLGDVYMKGSASFPADPGNFLYMVHRSAFIIHKNNRGQSRPVIYRLLKFLQIQTSVFMNIHKGGLIASVHSGIFSEKGHGGVLVRINLPVQESAHIKCGFVLCLRGDHPCLSIAVISLIVQKALDNKVCAFRCPCSKDDFFRVFSQKCSHLFSGLFYRLPGINRFDRIISVTGYNEDGRALVQDLHIIYMDYTEGLNTLMKNQDMEVYLADNADIVLTVAGDNTVQSSEILENVESCMSEHQNVYCHSGNSEEVHHAHDAGLSFGKYQAWQVLQDLNPDITLEEVQDMTMSEIRDLIRKYSREKSQDGDQNPEAENIQGSQNPDTGQKSEENSSDNTEEASDEGALSETSQQGHHGHQHHGDNTDD